MKMAMTALAVVFLAGAASSAFAQPDKGQGDRAQSSDDRPSRAEMAHDRPQRDGGNWGGGQRQFQPASRPPEAPRPAEAAQPQAQPRWDRGDRGQARWDRGDRGQPQPQPQAQPPSQAQDQPRVIRGWNPGASQGQSFNGRGQDGNRQGGDNRQAGDRQSWNGGDHGGDRRGDRGDRTAGDRRDWNDRRDGDRHDGDRRDWDRRDNDRNDRHDNDRRDWDHRDGRDHWERGRYPSVYFSHSRYHHSWRAPPGYYTRIWSFGDFLPRAWYGPDWWLDDPWSYELPYPPPGYHWVREGYDALMVDDYTGRIVQVVRDVFW